MKIHELLHPKEQIIKIIDRIYKRGMTTTSGGNISIKDEDGNIWITPSAIDKGTLRTSDIVCIAENGAILGRHKPSSEFPFHKAIYDTRPDIKSVIHAHPPALVSFSIVHQIPNTNVIPQAKNICGPIGYAKYKLPGSDKLGDVIAAEFAKGFKAVIMENHGIVLGGTDMDDAYQRFETLEFCASALLYGQMVGTPNYLSDEDIQAFYDQVVALPEASQKAMYPSKERAKRAEICTIVKRACQQGLMTSSYGTVSVRWDKNDFLITPRDFSRWEIQLEDIVQIRDGEREKGKYPSRATAIHHEIYQRNPEVNSIIMTQSPYLMAFAITDTHLDVRTIPESWIFLQDLMAYPFGDHFINGNHTKLLEEAKPALIIKNDSVLITGDELLQTFDRLEVAEFSAKSLVMGASLGDLKPINDQQIQELKEKFL
ncbi:Class II aldolase/adducin family protein [Croceitalea dokdonensis DOKDO 023]|uniref:Class II aldolase/adducin family protein n=1 Tax=Croceitalea dokdonensis DOKDO 023 TaxID=1300341 RepID=A0A0P7A294_9FLAO|nr:class II aldolase/adducin family protein [Croceitalea dokdonensis]KPM30565.1 Class II aldolase/adducin family protein [Croceitalea dokdonensis DOKDO 023]